MSNNSQAQQVVVIYLYVCIHVEIMKKKKTV